MTTDERKEGQQGFRKRFIEELYRRHGNVLGARSIDELADFVAPAQPAPRGSEALPSITHRMYLLCDKLYMNLKDTSVWHPEQFDQVGLTELFSQWKSLAHDYVTELCAPWAAATAPATGSEALRALVAKWRELQASFEEGSQKHTLGKEPGYGNGQLAIIYGHQAVVYKICADGLETALAAATAERTWRDCEQSHTYTILLSGDL